MTTQVSTDPEHIAVSRSRGIEIDWKDGHHSSFDLEYLRDWCPCASCTGAHGTEPREKTSPLNSELKSGKPATPDPFPMFRPRLRMESIEPVGSYALRIVWNDGHSTGIYSYSHLRSVCPCAECRDARAKS
jgi:DUF971 family protein